MKQLYVFITALFITYSAGSQSLYFPPTSGTTWDTISPQSLNWCSDKINKLYSFLDTNKTRAFILLKDGKIVLEKYFGTHTQNSFWQWNSAAKGITSFMTGIAQQEGYLSINDTSSKYLGKGWTKLTQPQEDKITIRHQLTMTTGLDDGVPDNYCTLDTCLIYKADPGTRWAYHNAPYTLLDSVIQMATGLSLNTYMNQKLKTPTGMTGLFVRVDYNNIYFSNARSMARFGLLLLNKGNWNGTPVLSDTAYFNQMTNTSQQLNKSYGYLWWLNGKQNFMIPQSQIVFPGYLCPNAPADMFSAMGKDGQFLNVIPSTNMVWIRMGEAPENLLVPFLLNDQIWKYVNDLSCSTTPVTEVDRSGFSFYPNPAKNEISIRSAQNITHIQLLNIQGQTVQTILQPGRSSTVDVSMLAKGFYFVKTTFTNGASITGKLVKE